jgi:hypothetical protein
MYLEVAKLGVLLLGLYLLQPLGLRAAAGAVGLAFGAMAVAGCAIVVREGVSPGRLLVGFAQPLLACGVMAAAVWTSNRVLVGLECDHPVTLLLVGIVVGAAAYIATALVIARDASLDLLRLLQRALRR